MQNLNSDVKVTRVMNAVAAGTTDQNSSSVDMAGHDGVRFIALLGALTATQVTRVKAQQSSDDGVADAWADLTGTQTAAMDDADDDQCVVLEVHRPRERYVRLVVERGTANAVIDAVVAEQYGAREKPVTHDTSTVQASETHSSPAKGTA